MKTQAQLEIENAELRGQVTALREMLEKLMAKPAPIVERVVVQPCALPHYPPIQVQPVYPQYPSPWWQVFPDGIQISCGRVDACGQQLLMYNNAAPPPTNGVFVQAQNMIGPAPTFGAYHMTVGGSS